MRRVGLIGVICLLACTGGPCEPSMGGYSITGVVLQRPLYSPDTFLLVSGGDPVCAGHPEGAIRFVAEQMEGGRVDLRLVEANPPEVAGCLQVFDVTVHQYSSDGMPGATPVGATAESIVAWPEGNTGRAWALSKPLVPEPTAYDGCMRRVDEILMPAGHL